jgi:hypothetical protein
MPLNKLENFIKNAEGRILYVNPNDLDSTDGIENQGNSLTKPFKTIQRALIESARFSYLRGDDNDLVEKTTILVFPGEHLIDNRPGYAIKDVANVATAVAPGGAETFAGSELTLTLNSNFDLTQEDNILYKFNSINGGIIIPRGTSIVGLDLRKTKVRPKYVPNPTDPNAPDSAIFRITGACYFWQFTFFDGDETGLVYTDPRDFSENNKSVPTFSHHKLTCFEYADGVNIPSGYDITDLDMFYSKVSNAFNRASGREIDQKFPASPDSFSKQRPEWEIVGAFASDPIKISRIISGDGATPGNIVTVTTQIAHGLNSGTPIKIRGINIADYNISTKVVNVLSDTAFTYSLPFVRSNLPAGPGAGLAPGADGSVTIETDTVSGASPYIFNVSLRSVFGMNGMHADGSKADGFRSMVVAQFTAVSLQKDDRAFVKYDPTSRLYGGIAVSRVAGDELSSGASSTNNQTVFHLDSDAVYREGWQTKHIKMSNDSVIQVVSVFAIGFHKHFECLSGGDASITNSNSNFGQFSLAADGFKRDPFGKDDKGFITNIITPQALVEDDIDVEWVQFDVTKTKAVGINNHLYLLGYSNEDIAPPIISQGYRVGAKVGDRVYLEDDSYYADIFMTDGPVTAANPTADGINSSVKLYNDVTVTTPLNRPEVSIYNITQHNLKNGESIRIFSEDGDLPEGLEENKVYYAITSERNTNSGQSNARPDSLNLSGAQIQIASSIANAESQTPIYITTYGGTKLRVESRISDKKAGELGHPIQYDPNENHWFIHTDVNSALFQYINTQVTTPESEISYLKRKEDNRSLDDKIYKLRYVVPKELVNTRDPVPGFVLQDSAVTNVREVTDFTETSITTADYDFDRNTRFISTCTYNNSTNLISIRSDKPHGLKLGDTVIISDVQSSTNTNAKATLGFNGTFKVDVVDNDKEFKIPDIDVFNSVHAPGNITSQPHIRNKSLPRFRRADVQSNYYVYRVETIRPYIFNVQDGVFYLYVINAGNSLPQEFTADKFSQSVIDLYPQLDRDNHSDNPEAAVSFAKRAPIGQVVTNDLKRSLTRETVDIYFDTFAHGNKVTASADNGTNATLSLESEHQLNGVRSFSALNAGSGHADGIYYNVKLLNDSSFAWDGATAECTVSGGQVTAAKITEGGSGYSGGEKLYFDGTTIGGTNQANIDIVTSGISTATDNYVQVTGIGTAQDGYYRITSVPGTSQIGIIKTNSDPRINVGQYIINAGRVATVTGTPTSSTDTTTNVITTTITTAQGHGLLAGSRITIRNANDDSLGVHVINSVPSPLTFTVLSKTAITDPKYVLKHILDAQNASANSASENLGVRGSVLYDNEVLLLEGNENSADVTTEDKLKVQLPTNLADNLIPSRFPLGSYVQVGNEIMRVKSSALTGAGNNLLEVIRGSMGTVIESHKVGTLIKKIKLDPIALHRPSILRASGHTFEYLGYGPGNYSTGLPQVQVRTLSENEEFLVQAQETSCGTVLYTGMDSDGDFYIGNTKYSAQSGEQTTFDVPTPTITGEDPNRLSVVFDEVIVKERILVEGGSSGQILSQFDGPVTFNGTVRMNKPLILNSDLRVTGKIDVSNSNRAEDVTDKNASLRVAGGAAIGKNVIIGQELDVKDNLNVVGISTLGGEVRVDTGIVPDADEGAYLGTAAKPFSQAHINEIRIGVSGDTEIDTATGGLTLDSAGGTTTVDDNLVVTGNLDVDGTTQLDGLNVDGNTTLDNTTINGTLSVSGSATIDQVTIDGSTVTATRFAGTADVANEVPVYGTDGRGFTNHDMSLMMNPSQVGSGQVQQLMRDQNIRFNTGAAELKCDGDIAAFASDDRLKTNKVGISNALDKVNALSGFTYNWNEFASEQGGQFNPTKRFVGVSAQEVEKVLPEAVTAAPFNDEYLTVKYDKLVPLLIEAIKELSDKVSSLEDKLNN